MYNIQKLLRSFRDAFRGVQKCYLLGQNMQIHTLALCVVIYWGIVASLSNLEWGMVMLCCMAVLSAECFNTALEQLCDGVCLDKLPWIANVKDIAAGGVLVLALFSLVVAGFLFGPHWLLLVRHIPQTLGICLIYQLIRAVIVKR